MNETGEAIPLLRARSSAGRNGCCDNKLRFFCSLTLVLIFFKGGEEMSMATRKQFVYAWSEAYVKSTQGTTTDNQTTTTNVSGSCAHERRSKIVEHEAQVMASQWELYFCILEAVLLFLSSSVYGTLSDYVGRKPFACLSLFGYAIKTTVLVFIIHYRLHIAFMFVAYMVDGLCGSGFAFSLFSYTMTADVTQDTRDRILGITIMETLIGIGRCTTQFANGYFIKATGFFYPMLTGTLSIALSFFLAIFCLQETRPQLSSYQTSAHSSNIQQNNSGRRINIPNISTLFRNYTGFYLGTEKDKHIFWLCFSVYFLLEFGILGLSDPLVLYQLGSPFCWNPELIGWYSGSVMVVCFVIGLTVLKPLQCCLPDCISACLGLVSAIAYDVVTALAKTSAEMFIAIGVGFIMILPKSILRGMASSRASKEKQGAMFAGLQSSELVCKLIAGPACLAIYSHTLTTMKGAVFLVLGGVNLVALLIMIRLAAYLLAIQRRDRQLLSA